MKRRLQRHSIWSPRINLRQCIFIFTLSCLANLSFSQSNEHRLQFTISTNCAALDLDVSYTFGSISGSYLGEGMFLEQEVTAPSGTISVSVSGICSTTGFSIESAFSDSFSFSSKDCSTQTFNHFPAIGQIVTLSIYHIPPRLIFLDDNPPTVGCENNITLTLDPSASTYLWEKSNDGSNWLPITPSQGTIATLTADLLHDPSFGAKYGSPRYVRVKPSICSTERISEPAGPFIFYPAPPSFTATPTDLLCFKTASGNPTGAITISSFTGVDPGDLYDVRLMGTDGFELNYTSLNSADINGNLFNSLEADTYEVRISNNLGNCFTDILGLVVDSPLEFTIQQLGSVSNVSCNLNDVGTKDDGSAQLTLQNGTGPFSYSAPEGAFTWSSSTSLTPTLQDFEFGTYTITSSYVNGSETCLSNDLPITIGQPNEITLSAVAIDINCKNTNTGSIDLTAAGGNGGYGFNWTGPSSYTSSSENIGSLYAGTYNVSVTDSKGCTDGLSQIINEPLVEIELSADIVSRMFTGGFDMTCAQNDGAILLRVDNEQLPITYTWEKDGIPFSPSSSSNPSDLAPGQYDISVDDNLGCHDELMVTLNPHPGISVNVSATSSFNGYNTKCPDSQDGEGSVISVTNGFGSFSYTWFDGSTNQTIQDLLPGNYAVTVLDGNGCSDDGTLSIIAPPAIQPNIQITSNYNGENISCNGLSDGVMEAFPINGFGSYSYVWDHGPITKSVSGLGEGSYAVTVTDDYGCFVKSTLSIDDPDEIILSLTKTSYNGSDLLCHNDANGEIQSTVTNGIAPFAYAWSNGASDPNISGLAAGDYTLLVTDQNNCVQSGSITILNPGPLSLAIQHVNDFNGFDISCNGLTDGAAQANLNGGTAPYAYLWSGGQTTSLVAGEDAGLKSLQVNDANNCVINGTITLVEPDQLEMGTTIDNPVSCFGGSDAQVSLNGLGGAGVYMYSLNGSSYTTSNVFAGLAAGEKDLFIKDGNGCVAQTARLITEPDNISIDFQNIVDSQCNDPNGSAQALAAGGNSGFSYDWYDDGTNQAINAGDVLMNVIAGIYRVEVKDSKDCTASDLVSISSIGGAEFNIENITPVSCFGFSNGSAEINVTSGTGPYNFIWSSGQTSSLANNLPSGNYFATVTDGFGCNTIKPVSINSPDAIVVSYNKSQPDCAGDCNGEIETSVVGGTQPYNYDWTDLSETTASVSGLCAGPYNLIVSDFNNCKIEESVILSEPQPLSILTSAIDPTCLGRCDGIAEVIGNGGTGAYQFQWLSGPTTSINTDLCPGEYSVTVSDSNGCAVNGATSILEGEPLSADLGEEATLCVGQSKILDIGSNWTTVEWTSTTGFASVVPVVSINDPGLYYLKAVDALGCIALDTFKLETSLDLLQAEFIMPSEIIAGDTLVAIDISWPLPERVEWNYPSTFTIINSNSPDVLFAIAHEAGSFNIGMESFLAECHDFREKELIVLIEDKGSDGGRLGYIGDLIQQFSVSPNPNDGRFEVNLFLSEEKSIRLQIISFPTGVIEAQFEGPITHYHNVEFDLSHLSQGMYFVLLKVGDEKRLLRFVKK